MKTIKKEDLIENEIYVFGDNFINKIRNEKLYIKFWISMDGKHFSKTPVQNNYSVIRNATPEEKHWLNLCIEQDKFIKYNKAMKTFIPEYVECIAEYGLAKVNTIYKTSNHNEANELFNLSWHKTLITYKNLQDRFKSSTKEAYDAQFITKDPEFVLPEKWCIKITDGNCLELINKLPKIGAGFLINQYIYYLNHNKNDFDDFKNWSWNMTESRKLSYNNHNISSNFVFTEITFEQFKQYVLKETVIKETIEPLPQFKVIETIETITKVENNEGSQFFIGDKVKSLSNVIYDITKFEYNENRTQIIAILNETSKFDINSIEHYIEPKIDFVLHEKWCLKSDDDLFVDYCNTHSVNSYSKIELSVNYAHFPSFHDCTTYPEIKIGYTEITLEQFKKYVLNKTIEVKEETLLEKAKRLYPVGTKIRSLLGRSSIIKTTDFYETSNSDTTVNIYADAGAYSIYCERQDKWATIVN
jgi:hypothetical protein